MSGVQLKAVQDLQTQLTKVMEELDHKVFRPQQKAAFQCSIKCTDLRGPQEEMHACLAKCGEPIQRHEAAVMGELQEFQHRVQRCVQQCQDKQATTQDQGKFDKCVSECAVFYQKELASLKPQLMKKR